jgi:Ulp1 family protease
MIMSLWQTARFLTEETFQNCVGKGYDCGVFVCLFALLLGQELPLDFHPIEDAQRMRRMMAVHIMNQAIHDYKH